MTLDTLWAVGVYDLRLTSEQFWSLVPRQFVDLLERERLARVRQEYGPAMIIAAIQAIFTKKRPDPFKFMPSYIDKVESEGMPWQQQMATLEGAVMAAGGGR